MGKKTEPRRGDLRRAILDVSLELVASGGVGALSMREVTRRAGVTHGAPYHYFSDRAAILAAIAEEGFILLTREMTEARDSAEGPRERFEACGRAYFYFAMNHPAHFRVMYRPELASPEHQGVLDRAAAPAFLLLVDCVTECQAGGFAPAGDPIPLVLTAWSSAHGLAALWIDGPMSRCVPGWGPDPARFVSVVSHTLGGLFAAGGGL
jgi:AcrR family transcriptional regulator